MYEVQVTLTGNEHWLIVSLLPDKGNPMVINYVNQLSPYANNVDFDSASDITVTVESDLVVYAFRQMGETQECIAKQNKSVEEKLLVQLSAQNCVELLQQLLAINQEFVNRRESKRIEGKSFCSMVKLPAIANA